MSPSPLTDEIMRLAYDYSRVGVLYDRGAPGAAKRVVDARKALHSRLVSLEQELEQTRKDARLIDKARDAWSSFAVHQSWCADCKASAKSCPIGMAALAEIEAANKAALYATFPSMDEQRGETTASLGDVVRVVADMFEEQERKRTYSSREGPRVPDLDARVARLRALAESLDRPESQSSTREEP